MFEVKTVQKSVADYLRIQIATGRFAANQKLNENILVSELGISRPPIREAFRILENEHLIKSIPRKGVYVTNVTIEDLLELCQAREMIECYVIDLLKIKKVTKIPKAELAIENACHLSLPSRDKPEELIHYHRVFFNFHTSLVEASGNNRIIHFFNILELSLMRYQIIYMYLPGARSHSIQQHREILKFINKSQYEKAKKGIKTHIKYISKSLREKIIKSTFGMQEEMGNERGK